jgi:O-acetyl-ADP-ribose deacetylase (regulator of RNase III)
MFGLEKVGDSLFSRVNLTMQKGGVPLVSKTGFGSIEAFEDMFPHDKKGPETREIHRREVRVSSIEPKSKTIGNTKITLMRGDIIALNVDAIVNAAKESLLGGGGVDGAIHEAAGPKLLEECEKLPYVKDVWGNVRCEVGDAVITGGYNLPAKHIIHTVGPNVGSREVTDEDRKNLERCYESCLRVCENNKLKSVAFCCISCGVFRFPNGAAADIAHQTTMKYLRSHPETCIENIIFCTFSDEQYRCYEPFMRA